MNDEQTVEKKKLQWHPAFYAGMQIEFEKESEELIFENEHQLGTKPKEVDVLIKKKNSNYQVKKNIGRFFRKYNLIEYKPPGDSLTIDDFYKVCGYACFYKANSAFVNAIKVEEITVTLVCFHEPRKMIKCLEEEGRYQILEIEKGIYYIEGGVFPIQLVITKLVSEKENFWLRNLTNKLQSTEKVQKEYQKHSNNKLYKSVMDIIVKANKELFDRREEEMCQALYEIYKEDLMKMAVEKVREEKGEELEVEVRKEIKAKVAKETEAKVRKEIKAEVAKETEVKAAEMAEAKIYKLTKEIVCNLIQNNNFTLEKALDLLMIPLEKRYLYENIKVGE